MNTVTTGRIGEAGAVNYLTERGYKIIELNYRAPMAEIDVIARDAKGTIIFFEVKYRSSNKFGTPSEAVSKHKQQKISQAAVCYLKYKRLLDCRARFDILEVTGEAPDYRFNHISDAFMSTVRF